ncbi:MAG: hypothetical protein LC437_04255, partial [Thiohalomonas sp.]|nr:hypothetical protein [Thiohalomonas sp.]
KVPMIAQALRIHETSILRHIKDYKGSEKLSTKSGDSSIPNQLENAGSNTWKLSLDSRINDNSKCSILHFQVDWV